jgi:hypothetical protein
MVEGTEKLTSLLQDFSDTVSCSHYPAWHDCTRKVTILLI